MVSEDMSRWLVAEPWGALCGGTCEPRLLVRLQMDRWCPGQDRQQGLKEHLPASSTAWEQPRQREDVADFPVSGVPL